MKKFWRRITREKKIVKQTTNIYKGCRLWDGWACSSLRVKGELKKKSKVCSLPILSFHILPSTFRLMWTFVGLKPNYYSYFFFFFSFLWNDSLIILVNLSYYASRSFTNQQNNNNNIYKEIFFFPQPCYGQLGFPFFFKKNIILHLIFHIQNYIIKAYINSFNKLVINQATYIFTSGCACNSVCIYADQNGQF